MGLSEAQNQRDFVQIEGLCNFVHSEARFGRKAFFPWAAHHVDCPRPCEPQEELLRSEISCEYTDLV